MNGSSNAKWSKTSLQTINDKRTFFTALCWYDSQVCRSTNQFDRKIARRLQRKATLSPSPTCLDVCNFKKIYCSTSSRFLAEELKKKYGNQSNWKQLQFIIDSKVQAGAREREKQKHFESNKSHWHEMPRYLIEEKNISLFSFCRFPVRARQRWTNQLQKKREKGMLMK